MSTRSIRRFLRWAVPACLFLMAVRMAVLALVTPSAPPLSQKPQAKLEHDGSVRSCGRSWARPRGPVLQVHLQGEPEAIGDAHACLLRTQMRRNEQALWGVFEDLVPTRPLRTVLMDTARLRFSGIDDSLGYPRRAEIAASARAFQPDPFDDLLPTYPRFLLLNALYDVSLSFEHSPLIGCSSVFFAHAPRGPLLGRTFDFETHEVFDREKAVLLFAENGKIPVLSVAWPGLAGVVTGMNAAGVAAVVHGARAGVPSPLGQPVLVTVREALAHAETAERAAAWIADREPMVSHIVFLADAHGSSFVVERVPGRRADLRRGGETVALTNHFEGASATDPANLRVQEQTSTLARRERLDVLVGDAHEVDEQRVLAMLRDRRAADGSVLPAGDRRAIDADIATHGVVMNLRERVVWVSEGPHLSGAFVRFDLTRWVREPEGERMRQGWSRLGK